MKKWCFEELREIALKYKTKGEFKKKNRRAYSAAIRRSDYNLIVIHMPKYLNKLGLESHRNKWSEEALSSEALKYIRRQDFCRGSRNAYFAAIARGTQFMDLICSHMTESKTKAWTDEELHEEALKYSTRGEFQKNSAGACKTARQRGIIDRICSHMPKHVDQSGENNWAFKWTEEMLQIEANKYERRVDFEEANPAAVQAARKRGILDKMCKEMKPSAGSSRAERELFNAIKSLYPNAKKLRDMKVNIPNKPYIHGFEIDILVGNLGIEFDGMYHHSFRVMRADPKRSKWSDDDIRNYHELKDAWFSSKGIQILHIKEEDWKLDKQACIDKCLEFLTYS